LPVDLLGILLELGDDRGDGLVDAALQVHRVGRRRRSWRLRGDRLGEHGRGGGAVAGDVVGLGGDFAHHLGAHVLELVLELDLLGDGDAVLGDARGAEGLVDDDVAALGAERDLDGVGEDVDASILTSVPDHLPNRMRSPALTSSGTSLPLSSRAPGPTAMTSPSCGFSLAVSGMMMPPLVLPSSSTRLTTTRS
jgi:hypothetical protein